MTLTDGYHPVPAGKLAMVVTYLEMSAPAPLRGTALPKGVSFEPLPRDLDAYRDLFRRIGEDWLWFGRLLLDDDALRAILNDPAVDLWCLKRDGAPEALLELDFRVAGECELAYFGLTSALIGTGSGGYLMDRAIEMAWQRDISRFHLHTCTLDSPQALGFYTRSGFTPTRREIELAEDPRKLGLYPETAAPQIPML